MLVKWHENPLKSQIYLDAHEKQEIWLKSKLEQFEWALTRVKIDLDDNNIERVKKRINYEYLVGGDVDKEIDERLKEYIEALQDTHLGDCTCFATSCVKCHAESLLGFSTIIGLGGHEAHKIEYAFEKFETVDKVLNHLQNYEVGPKPDTWPKDLDYDIHIPRWKKESERAYKWLKNYTENHFSKQHGLPSKLHYTNKNKELENKIQEMYYNVPEHIREDIVEASIWAKDTLTKHEGEGHLIHLSTDSKGSIVCSFAKPSWSGDHCGRPMNDGAEAIVVAVCEYMCGA